MPNERFDLIVLGAGSAAREAAAHATTDHGRSVALVERLRWGGDCPNVACKPTKQYVAAAELLRDTREIANELGIEVAPPSFDLARLKARKDWLVGTQEAWRKRLDDAGYHTVAGQGRFLDAQTIAVGDRILAAERVLIATGSRTAVPPVRGIDQVDWLDHVSALELTELPRSLAVLGAGAVGLEFAQVFARFGTSVTLVEGAPRIAPLADADTAAEVRAALVDEGLEIVTNTFATAVARDGDELELTLAPRDGSPERTIRVERLLLASGRVPNVEALDLERVDVEATRAGIVVDEHMRTTADGIWAAGDVTATIQLTPIAGYQAQVAVDDMFGGGTRVADYSALPTAIFTDPELAGVGLTEEQAKEQGFEVETASYDAKALIRPYYFDDAPHGLLKLVFERGSRRLLGLHAAVRAGSELLQGYALALRLGATVDDLALGHYAFPTYGEGLHYAAEAAIAPAAALSPKGS
jgi:pyruvate/2-oxoglutarate dehydrogenase complex dihydrolipoamide dehydrogenase (E3) component